MRDGADEFRLARRHRAENSKAHDPMQKNTDKPTIPLPFSRPLQAAAVPPEGLDIAIHANDQECAALALENDLRALSGLEASFRIVRSGKDGLEVSGAVRAKIRQTCVVSLEQFDSLVDEPVHMRFVPPEASATPRAPYGRRNAPRDDKGAKNRLVAEEEAAPQQIIDLDDDTPDPLVGGAIDLGAIASEFLTLGIDPYPRSPGASFSEPEPAPEAPGPFAVLRQVNAKDGDG